MSSTEIIKEAKKATAFNWSEKTILIVEDDRTHRSLMDKILKECMFQTMLAENGLTALARLDSGAKFDLIIMDWDMPELNGLETVREIRKRQAAGKIPYIPVVGFTANRQPGDRETCLAAGMDAYLPKDVWLPRWRGTLIDNLLQGLIVGDFDVRDVNSAYLCEEIENRKETFDLDAFDANAFEQTASLLKAELPVAVEEYLEDAAAYIRDARAGLEAGSAEKIARASHPLKSNSKGFGLISVSQIAGAINDAARKNDFATVELFLPQLLNAFQRAEKKLREIIRHSEF